ncbi:hypothetical protein A5712_27870 [Mycobacterium sp. E2327]|uniref:acyl-CoA thioesterase n=1 Tax=Mycobacterium sp. E2327 TaxID=1834132 RepID=UPI0007FD251C|nr:thioesterase family protein [Mycobacterium sp. E2327]OBI15739.1 hypothetical protein A5712_27870 [Mycobacterium sp. E2327]
MELDDLLASIKPARTGQGRYEASPYDRGAGVVDAGTLSALMSAAGADGGQPLRSLHATFFRSADPALGVSLQVEEVHSGRTLGVRGISVTQHDRKVAVGHLVVGPTTDALIEHADGPVALPPMPDTDPPYAGSLHPGFSPVVGDVDPFDAERTWPPTWQIWVDCQHVRRDGPLEAYLAFHANEYLVSAAVLPHRGFGMHEAHRGVLTVITASDVVFHDVAAIDRWVLFEQTNTYAGAGWLYGRGAAYNDSGRPVASFSQQAILRAATRPHKCTV